MHSRCLAVSVSEPLPRQWQTSQLRWSCKPYKRFQSQCHVSAASLKCLLLAYSCRNNSTLNVCTDLKIEWIEHRCSLIRRTVKPAEATLGLTVWCTDCASFSRLLNHYTVEFQYGDRLTSGPRTAMRDPFILRPVNVCLCEPLWTYIKVKVIETDEHEQNMLCISLPSCQVWMPLLKYCPRYGYYSTRLPLVKFETQLWPWVKSKVTGLRKDYYYRPLVGLSSQRTWWELLQRFLK